MKNKTKTIKFAFKMSLPVLFGYLFLGSAFGISLYEIGYNWIWAIVISLLVYAGSGQLLLVSMIASHASLASIAVMTFFVNSRHIFYGLSFIEKFRSYGWRYPSLIFHSQTKLTGSTLHSTQLQRMLTKVTQDF